ncbi:hypothetical protein HHX47_DHR1001745 [Lentinula edodes]|nr:hypothetical protein HHX47_DHR1001745 [Lentinula edodes]
MIESPPLNVNQTAQVGVIKLSKEQKQVLETVKAGGNVFFTGPAGTGKSVLLREIIKVLRSRKLEVAVTASTGIAGINIKGSTVHSWAGIGLGKEKAAILASRIANSTHARLSWTETDVLIIDEISMIDGRLFDKLEYIGRIVRNNSRPFGGIQLVISGDFFQLPPVPDKSYQHKMPSVFAFDAESWPLCIKKIVLLTHVFRQRDQAFVDILAEMRVGKLSDDHIKALHALRRPVVHPDGIEPSHLFATKLEVQDCNQRKLDALRSTSVTYHSMDYRGIDVHKNLIDKKRGSEATF